MIACPRFELGLLEAQAVHLDDEGELGLDVDVGAVGEHVEAELVEQEQFLWKVVPAGQLGEPGCHPVHLVGGYLADVAHVTLARRQSPFRIEGQADVGLGQQFFVAHGLGKEVCVPGLQIEDDVEPRRGSRVDPWADVIDRALQRVVAVSASLRRGDRRDDLERRDHQLRADTAVAGSNVSRPLYGSIHRLLAEHPEIAVAGVAVDGDETSTGEEHVAATGQLRPRNHGRGTRGADGGGGRGADGGGGGGWWWMSPCRSWPTPCTPPPPTTPRRPRHGRTCSTASKSGIRLVAPTRSSDSPQRAEVSPSDHRDR